MKFLLGLLPSWAPFAIVGVIALGVVGVYYGWRTEERAVGASAVVQADQKATIQTQKRIDNAESAAPRTPAAVSRSLRDGTF